MSVPIRRRISWPFVVIALSALALAALAYALSSHQAPGVPLSPSNAAPDGSRALARVLEQHGVTVHEASDLDAAREDLSPRSTLVVTDGGDLTRRDAEELLDAAGGARIVVVTPNDDVRELIVPRSRSFADEPVYPAASSARRVLINDASLLRNGSITDGDNARLAIRALGGSRDLVWISDWQGRQADQDQGGLAWPSWMEPLVWALTLSVLALVLTRGRRFGRLATEPLPVLVRSIESTRALATAYRRNHARDAATRALQEGAADRMARHLGLPRGSHTPQAVRASLDHDPQAACLTAPTPRSDQDLVVLAQQLTELEKEITRE